jgi:carnitine O-acetyltransferase
MTTVERNPPKSRTFASQDKLPKLPIPPLEDTCRRYLRALEGLQSSEEHEATKRVVSEFLQGDGPRLQERLKQFDLTKDRRVSCFYAVYSLSDVVDSYIEDFW